MEIINQISPTKRDVYTFYQDKLTFYLNTYKLEEKFPPKRNYTVIKNYARLSSNRSSTMQESEVPLTDEIKQLERRDK